MFVLKKVDYKTLLFFIGLFVVVGGLEITGILEIIAGLIAKFGGGKPMILITIVIWISAIASAFVDNIQFVYRQRHVRLLHIGRFKQQPTGKVEHETFFMEVVLRQQIERRLVQGV